MIRELALVDVYFLLLALRWTIGLTLLALLGGGAVGLFVAAFGAARNPVLRGFALVYVGTVQGIPLLGWLFIFYFGLSIVGYNLPPLVAATVGFSIYAGAFLGEIWRGALVAIPKTQWEPVRSIQTCALMHQKCQDLYSPEIHHFPRRALACQDKSQDMEFHCGLSK